MSSMPAPIGHNLGPVTIPTEEDMLADLKRRYPEIDKDYADIVEALKTYPAKLTLEQADTAAALQDLLGKMRKHRSIIDAHRKSEKKPWDRIVKVVQNFFISADERIEKLMAHWGEVHASYLELKRDDERRKEEERLEAQRQETERLQREAQEAEDRRREAERAEAEARQREEDARKRAEEEQRRREEAEAAAEAARKEEERIATERKERERAEKAANDEGLREIKRLIRDAEKLHGLAEGGEATDEEIAALDNLIKPGGQIGLLGGKVAASVLLTDDQRTSVETVRARLGEMRQAQQARIDAAEAKRREEEAAAEEARLASEREERARQRQEQDAERERLRAETEAREAEAAAAKKNQKAAEKDARTAIKDQTSAAKDQKAAGREAAALGTEADRSGNRADRIERRLENATEADMSRTRGELGTVGSLARRWRHYIVDEAALRAGFRMPGDMQPPCVELADLLTTEALNGAVYQWMRAHQGGFIGERVDTALPGVVFAYETESRIA